MGPVLLALGLLRQQCYSLALLPLRATESESHGMVEQKKVQWALFHRFLLTLDSLPESEWPSVHLRLRQPQQLCLMEKRVQRREAGERARSQTQSQGLLRNNVIGFTSKL